MSEAQDQGAILEQLKQAGFFSSDGPRVGLLKDAGIACYGAGLAATGTAVVLGGVGAMASDDPRAALAGKLTDEQRATLRAALGLDALPNPDAAAPSDAQAPPSEAKGG